MKHKILLLGLIIIQFCLHEQVYAEDLLQIYQLAEQNDPVYLGSEAQFEADKEIKAQSWAVLMPQVSASASRREKNQTVTVTSSSTDYSFTNESYSLNISQALYHHADFLRISQASESVLKAQAEFKLSKQELILRVAEKYFNVLASMDNLSFAEADQKAISRRLEQSEQKFKVGLIAITDVHESRSRNDQSIAKTIVAQNQLQIAFENLREMTGQSHKNIQPLSHTIPLLTPQPKNIETWVNTAIDNNLSVLATKKSMLVAQKEIDIQRAGHYPELDLVARRGRTKIGGGYFGNYTTDETQVSVELNVPLFAGGYVSSKTAQARFKFNVAKQNHERTRRAIQRETRSAYLNVLALVSQVKALKQAMISSDLALETTQAGFEVGTRTVVDVLNAQQEVFLARQNHARARYDYVLETLRLKKAAGTLTSADVERINRWIQ